MHKFIAGIALLLLVFTLSAQSTDDWPPGEYLRQATDNAFEKASVMHALSKFSYAENLVLAGALITVGSTIALDVELTAGVHYSFIGGGDADVVDLDMYLVDSDGEVVAADVEDDATPIPDFTPTRTGRYSLRLQLISGEDEKSFVSLVVLTDAGYSLTDGDIAAVSDDFFATGAALNDASSGIKWQDLTNQWCLFGLVLPPQRSWTFSNLYLGDRQYYAIGTMPDENAKLDLIVRDERGEPAAADEEDDNFPMLEFFASATQRYDLEIVRRGGKAPALILVGLLTE